MHQDTISSCRTGGRRTAPALAGLLLTVLALTACGGDAEAEPGGADRDQGEATSSASGWTGTAEGTLEAGGLVETWSATYALDAVVEGFNYDGAATITWSLSGEDDQGCDYSGTAELEGGAGLSTFTDTGTYALQVHRVAGPTVPVQVTCGDQAPTTEEFQPLNTDAGDASEQPLPAPGDALAGTLTYVPMGGDGSVTWSWDVQPS